MGGPTIASEKAAKELEKEWKPKTRKYKRKLAEAIDKKTPETLIEAHNEWRSMKEGPYFIGNFIQEILSEKKLEEDLSTKEFPEIEYETKLDVQISKRPNEETSPIRYLDHLLESLESNSQFLQGRAGSVLPRASENHYFEREGRDVLVVMRGENQINLKYKEDLEKLSIGLENEWFILKRKERVERDCPESRVMAEVQREILQGGRYIGRIQRDRARADFLSSKTGRIYLVVFDICDIFPEKKEPFTKKQIEIEYVGYIPYLSTVFKKESEEQIGEELLEFSDRIINSFEGREIRREKRYDSKKVLFDKVEKVRHTIERKFDFLK